MEARTIPHPAIGFCGYRGPVPFHPRSPATSALVRSISPAAPSQAIPGLIVCTVQPRGARGAAQAPPTPTHRRPPGRAQPNTASLASNDPAPDCSRPHSPGGPRRAPGKWRRQRLLGTQISPFPDLEGQAVEHSPRQPLGPHGALR